LDSEYGRYWSLSDFFAAENSNKFPKTRFWKEKSVEDVVTLGPTAQATLVVMEPTIVTNCHEIHPIAKTSLDPILCSFQNLVFPNVFHIVPSCSHQVLVDY